MEKTNTMLDDEENEDEGEGGNAEVTDDEDEDSATVNEKGGATTKKKRQSHRLKTRADEQVCASSATPIIPVFSSTGSKTEAVARCYCGRVRLKIAPAADKPLESWFCHCRSCQLASGAPLMLAVTTFAREVTVLAGEECLTQRNDIEYNSDGMVIKESTGFGFKRQFCSNCGTQMRMKRVGLYGSNVVSATTLTSITFPATYEETLDKFVPGWQPSAHYHTADSCINTKCMVDGLPKLDDGGGAAVMASSGPEAPSTERI